jgi:hypothetical protein
LLVQNLPCSALFQAGLPHLSKHLDSSH